MELDKNVNKIELLMANIKEKLRKLQLSQLSHIQKVEHSNCFELDMDINIDINILKANLKIKEIYKVGGIGVVLLLETISPGYVQCGFNYKVITGNGVCNSVGNGVVDAEDNARKIVITIKSFENNFCPSEFEHPNNDICACVKMNGCSLSDLQKDMILEAI